MRYLSHLKAAWNQAHPEAPFEQQQRHGDDSGLVRPGRARADRRGGAGWPASSNLTLLEEPQAALYSWIQQQRRRLAQGGAGAAT